MQYYQRQLDVMIEALAVGQLAPPLKVAQDFAKTRLNACSRAVSMHNLFVPARGSFPVADTNSTFTVYSKPLQRDVIVMGCALMNQNELAINRLKGEFRLRLPEPLSHLSQNYIFPAMAFAPATYSVFFPAPFILKASEQVAIDFGWNAPAAQEPMDTKVVEIVLFCVAVKDCLSGEDQELLRECTALIAASPYQRRLYLNSFTRGSRAVTSQTNSPFQSASDNMIVYDPQNVSNSPVAKGSLTSSETPPTNTPMLVVGVAINSCGEAIRITDTGTGHSFTQGDFIFAHQIYYPEEFLVNQTRSAYFSFFRLPVPHLLKAGATLFTEHLATVDSDQTPFNPEYMVWECVTP